MKPPFPADYGFDFSATGPVGIPDVMLHTTTPELVRAHYEEAKRLALIQSLKGTDNIFHGKRWKDELMWIKENYKEELGDA